MKLVGKYLAGFVRWIRQYYVDVEINYWISSKGNFINGFGQKTDVDTAFEDLLRSLRKYGIHNDDGEYSEYYLRSIIRARKDAVVTIICDGICYTVNIKFTHIE